MKITSGVMTCDCTGTTFHIESLLPPIGSDVMCLTCCDCGRKALLETRPETLKDLPEETNKR